jgi:hypothetical protein
MVRLILCSLLWLVLAILPAESWARGGRGGGGGFGGGGFGGGAGRSSGGFSGGAGRSSSGFSGGASQHSTGAGFSGRSYAAGAATSRPSSGGAGNARPSTGAVNGSRAAGNHGFGSSRTGAGGFGQAGQHPSGSGRVGTQGLSGERFSSPNRSQLNSFLGLPSDGGLSHHSASAGTHSDTPAQLPVGGNIDVNRGTATGPRGGQISGITATGPNGNTVGRAVGVGPQGGVATIGGVQGVGGVTAARGIAVGPGGNVAAGRAIAGPAGGVAGGGIIAGPAGVAGGFVRVSPSGRYATGVAVRTNYHHWGVYGAGWHTDYPGAWFAAGWAAGAVWNACTWGTASTYCGCSEAAPVSNDYGSNVTYEDNSVYVNGENVGTSEEYYDQASEIAKSGADADAASEGDWLPLGVFALATADQAQSDITIQLAVNKEGVIRGNYTDSKAGTNEIVQGSVDKETQRVAFTVGDNAVNVLETALYNLTQDEAPCLLHLGKESTEQMLLVRLQRPENAEG